MSLLRRFGKEEPGEEIPELLKICRDQFETEELESALEGIPHPQEGSDFDLSWEVFLEPLRTLNERIALGAGPRCAGLWSPHRPRSTHQNRLSSRALPDPPMMVRRRSDENRILVKVDNRPHSEMQLAHAPDYIPVVASQGSPYKKFLPLATGAVILVILVLAIVVLSLASSAPGTLPNNSSAGLLESPPGLIRINNTTFTASVLDQKPMVVEPPVRTIPTPVSTPQYVTIEYITPEPDTGPESHLEEYKKLASVENFLYDPLDYLTIYANDMEYNLVNAYRMSYELNNPPMIIRYDVVPRNTTDVKWFEPRDARKVVDTAVINRSFEESWFEIKVYRDGVIYDQVGWGGIYAIPLYEQST